MATISSNAAASMASSSAPPSLDADEKSALAAALEEEKGVDEASLAPFPLQLPVEANASGWGPTKQVEGFGNVPFTPFSKADKLGRASDWNSNYNRSRFQQSFADGAASTFAYKAEDDETTFSLVDNKPKPRRSGGRGGGAFTRSRGPPGSAARGRARARGRGRRTPANSSRWGVGGRRGGWGTNPWDETKPKEPSVRVRDDWRTVQEIDLGELAYEYADVPDAELLTTAGHVDEYNKKAFDFVSPNAPVTLQTYDHRVRAPVGVLDDPVVRELAAEDAGNVFASDTLLAVLMAAPRSVNSWDVVFSRRGGRLYVEKRPTAGVDALQVNETWHETHSLEETSINYPPRLSEEATRIDANFSQQVLLKSGRKQLDRPHPYARQVPSGAEMASCGYHYRRFALGDRIRLVARCEVGAVDAEGQTLAVHTFNEFNARLSGGVDWRSALANQLGAVLATTFKNDACKVARFASQALVAGVDQFKVGFVSRAHTKDPKHHVILKTQTFKPEQLALQCKLKEVAIWGSLKAVVEAVLDEGDDDADFILLRDPKEARLTLYRLPAGGLAQANNPQPHDNE